MQRFYLTILSFVVVLAMVGSVSAGGSGGLECKARLSGDQEVTTPPGGVVTDTTGKFRISFNDDETIAEYRLEVRDGVRVTQAHIHCAPAGVNGPIVAFLAGFHDRGWDVDGRWIDNATLTDDNVLAAATPSPTCPNDINNLRDLAQAGRDGNLYANVHTIAHAGGEVRGQLECEDED
jgi:hypothetical protein